METVQRYSNPVTTIADLADNLTTKKELAQIFIKSGLIPNQLNTPEKVLVAMFKCQELGLPPLEGMAGMAVINGKVTLQGNLILAMINRSGKAKQISVKDSETKCEVTMSRRDYENTYTFSFTLDDAKKANLTNKQVWKEYQKTMLKWRAVSGCARVVFPDIIGGLYTPEEMASITDAEIIVDEEENVIIKEKPKVKSTLVLGTNQLTGTKEITPPASSNEATELNKEAAEMFEPKSNELNPEILDKIKKAKTQTALKNIWFELSDEDRPRYLDVLGTRKSILKANKNG